MNQPTHGLTGSLAVEIHQHRQWLGRLKTELAVIEENFDLKRDPEISRRIQDLEPRLNDPTCRLVVVGRINTGKSTLINALIGAGVLSRNPAPETSTITRIRQGNEYSLTWTEQGGLQAVHKEVAKDLEDLREKVYRFTGDQGQFRRAVKDLLVTLPAHGWPLPEGVELIDTPGLSDQDEERSALTSEYIGRADAILFTITSTEGMDQGDQQELEKLYVLLSQSQNRIFCAATKIDSVRGAVKAWTKMTLKGNETLQELFIRQLKLPGLKSEAGQTISDRVFPTAAGAFLFVNPGRMLEPAEREDPDVMAEARREFPGKFGLPDWTSETAAAEATGIAALRQGLSSFLAQGAIQAWSNLCREQRVALEQLVTSWIQDQLQKTELALTYAQSALTERLELRRAHESKLVAVQAEVEEIQTNMGQIERLKTSLFEKIEQAKDKALEELRVLKVGG